MTFKSAQRVFFKQENSLRMKNPNRKVVVEYKHRRFRKETTSLWGNLDLKSIAKEVDALNLPPSADENVNPPSRESARSESEASVTEIASELFSDNEIFKEIQLKQDIPVINKHEPEEPTGVQPSAHVATTVKKAVVIVKTIHSRRPKENATEQRTQIVKQAQTDEAVRIELSGLELENFRLKRELAEKLIEENKHLFEMLQRQRLRMS